MNKSGSNREIKINKLFQHIENQVKIIEEQKNKLSQLDIENFRLKNLIDNLR